MILNNDLILQFEESDCEFVKEFGPCTNPIGAVKTISISHANKLLRDEMSKWPVVSGSVDEFSMSEWRSTHGRGTEKDTHRSRIAPPQPIKQETVEGVAKELEYYINNPSAWGTEFSQEGSDLLEKLVRKVLNK